MGEATPSAMSNGFLGEVKRASSGIFQTSGPGSMLLLKRETKCWSGIKVDVYYDDLLLMKTL